MNIKLQSILRICLGIVFIYFNLQVGNNIMSEMNYQRPAIAVGLSFSAVWSLINSLYLILNGVRTLNGKKLTFRFGYWSFLIWVLIYSSIGLSVIYEGIFNPNLGLLWVIPLHIVTYYFVIIDFKKNN